MEQEEYECIDWEEIEQDDDYTQLCVWPGTVVEQDDVDNGTLAGWFKDEFQFEHPIKLVGCVTTLPDRENGKNVEGTGGRHDLMFFVHNEDIMKFSLARLGFGIRWWEDVVLNKSHTIYPSDFRKYGKEVYSW
jgi:hypothetical protein